MSLDVGPFEMPLDGDVRLAVEVAVLEAADHDHEAIEVEHLALALLADPEIARLLDRVAARAEEIDGALEEALASRRRVAVLDGERPMSATVGYAVRRASDSGEVERMSLLAALFAQSPAAPAIAAAGASPAQLALASRLAASDAAGGSPYRSAKAERSWTLHVASDAVVPRTLRTGVAELLGLSRFASARVAIGAPRPEGVDVGLFTEADAKHHAGVVASQAQAAGLTLAVEARQCRSDASLAAARVRVRRWWRAVQGLRVVAVLFALAALGLVTVQAKEHATLSAAEAAAAPDGYVRVRAQAMFENPRFLLPEGELFVSDPRQPEDFATPFSCHRLIDTRVSMRYLPEPELSFEGERRIASERGVRTVRASWALLTCTNCSSDVLVVRSDPSVRLGKKELALATVRPAGAEVKALVRAQGVPRDVWYVIDLDPLPDGPTRRLVPICVDEGIVDPRCSPVMWGITDGDRAPTPRAGKNVYEGLLTTSDDPRLRVRGGAQARILRFGAQPRPPQRFLFAAGICALAALLFGAAAQMVRRRGRPARAR